MADSDEALHLLAAARKDWRALTGMADPSVFADEVFGFHAQQAVEKALKAWLAALGVEYPRTHDLSLLLEGLREDGQPVGPFDGLVEFNPYAVQFRYEAFDELGSPLDRGAVVGGIQKLLHAVDRVIAEAGTTPT